MGGGWGGGMSEQVSRWLEWAREIHALAETSLHYAKNSFERTRAERLIEIAAEIVSTHSVMSKQEVQVAFSAQPGYITPKVDVRGAVFHEDKILLVREIMDDGWTLPGGWADVGESPRVAIEREVLEEAGLSVKATRIVGVYDANRIETALPLYHAYKLVFLCEPLSGGLSTSSETSEVGYFPFDDLPHPLSAYRTLPRHIEDAVASYRDPDRATGFD
jgi:ADP-ribose pyrophosphatase YjhB (NUDIX family)